MATGDNSTTVLLDMIRKELSSIINDGPTEIKQTSAGVTVGKGQGDTMRDNKSLKRLGRLNLQSDCGATSDYTQKSTDLELLASKRSVGPDDQSVTTLDADLQKMRFDLQQSYELFQTMGEKFDAINFSSLKSRIKELSVTEKNRNTKFGQEVKDMLHNSYSKDKLDSLTNEMGEKFRKHPGEFGDIPELSDFFQACTQLQNGLEQLKKQRNSMTDLSQRVCSANEVTYDRVDEIRKSVCERAKERND